MNEEEFLKEHPSLIGKTRPNYHPDWSHPTHMALLEDIHETQLDKQKVKKVIDEDITFFLLQTKERANKVKVNYARYVLSILWAIKKVLGLE